MKLKVTISGLLFVIHLFAFSETGPNNSLQQANNLPNNGNESGSLTGTDTEDWNMIDIPNGGIFTLTIKKAGVGYGAMVFFDGEKAGNPEIGNLYIPYLNSPENGWTLTVPVFGGKYYLKFLKSSGVFDYQVGAVLTLPAFGEDTEPNDTITNAVVMPLTGTISGTLHYYEAGKGYDNKGWYKITVPRGGILNLVIHKKGAGDTWFRFLDRLKQGYPEITNYYFNLMGTPAEGAKWSYPVLAGTYYFLFEGGKNVVDYKLDISIEKPVYNEDTEPNDSMKFAQNFAVNDSVSGLLGYYRPGSGIDNGLSSTLRQQVR